MTRKLFLLFLTNNTLPYSDFGVEDASVIDFAPPTQLNGNNGEWTNGDDVNGRHLRQQARNGVPIIPGESPPPGGYVPSTPRKKRNSRRRKARQKPPNQILEGVVQPVVGNIPPPVMQEMEVPVVEEALLLGGDDIEGDVEGVDHQARAQARIKLLTPGKDLLVESVSLGVLNTLYRPMHWLRYFLTLMMLCCIVVDLSVFGPYFFIEHPFLVVSVITTYVFVAWHIPRYFSGKLMMSGSIYGITGIGLSGRTYSEHRFFPFSRRDLGTHPLRALGFNGYVNVPIYPSVVEHVLIEYGGVDINDRTVELFSSVLFQLCKTGGKYHGCDLEIMTNSVNSAYQQHCLRKIKGNQCKGRVVGSYTYMTPEQL